MTETFFSRDTLPAPQFESIGQQSLAATLGMWAFLATEVLFFGVLFAGFFIYRSMAPGDFAETARELSWPLGTLNTAILLGSSFSMAMAVHHAKEGDNRRVARWLLLTGGLGMLFLGIKATEYFLEYREHLIPALNYAATFDGHDRPRRGELFMTFYFVMTGFHAVHMFIGLGVIGTLVAMARRGKFSRDYPNPVEVAGLYWHFVDLVWVFLFPMLYLLRHP
jgi:cytochrome c oxidase subunit III